MTQSLEGEQRRQGIRRGVGMALLSAMLFGMSAPFAKVLLRGASPQLLAGLLYLGSGIGLALVWVLRKGRTREAGLGRRDIPWLVGSIAAGGVAAPLFLMYGLARTPAASASLLLNLEGALTALLAWIVFRENFHRRIALGMVAIVAGGAVLSWEGRVALGGLLGPLAIAGACLAWAIDNNLTQKVSGGDPVQIAMLKGLCAGSMNTVFALALGASMPVSSRVMAALALGFFGYGVSLVLFVLALRHLGTARTGSFFSIAPFVGALVSLAVFGQAPSVALIVGAVLMGLGVWLLLSERHEHQHVHVALKHEHLHIHDVHHQHAHSQVDPPGEPHSHAHRHDPLVHSHPHYPDLHHRHGHE